MSRTSHGIESPGASVAASVHKSDIAYDSRRPEERKTRRQLESLFRKQPHSHSSDHNPVLGPTKRKCQSISVVYPTQNLIALRWHGQDANAVAKAKSAFEKLLAGDFAMNGDLARLRWSINFWPSPSFFKTLIIAEAVTLVTSLVSIFSSGLWPTRGTVVF